MELYLFRFSLKPKSQADVFERTAGDGVRFSRESWIRDFFSREQTFSHRGSRFVFVPTPPSESGLPAPIIAGWISRPKVLRERTHPDQGLEPVERESWRAALLLVDPTAHEDGQKVALEDNPDIGAPAAVLSSLVRAMNEQSHAEPFTAQVYAIVEEASFARFAEEHGYQIKVLTFRAAVPNMFESADDFSNELRALRDKANVTHVTTTLKSDGILETSGNKITEIVEYTERGLGKVQAKAADGAIYRSQDHAAYATLDLGQPEQDEKGFFARLVQLLDKIF